MMPGDPEWDAVLEGLEQDRQELEARDPEIAAAHRYHEQLQREIEQHDTPDNNWMRAVHTQHVLDDLAVQTEQDDEEFRTYLERHGDPQLTGDAVPPPGVRRYLLGYEYDNEGLVPPPATGIPPAAPFQRGRNVMDMIQDAERRDPFPTTEVGCQPGLDLDE